ncbi:helix-turn-helix transcriptional regulator [Aquimarina sp. D1M17]|uniref:winged helix-turn-helix transcriptional regulator n=1 Tax=Aquimarina acroporae TaxID=2937283 RepID=UPI0020C12BE5|nr:helix-turn-helix domain-containing protein [Aquimarina acroporae]MCK8522834.1 helix-turn-helix transcriptional regulator [Aquimarina acroporae]
MKKIEENKNLIDELPCGVKTTMSVIGGKWKIRIIYALYLNINRFGVMHRHINNISKKMLTDSLRELEADGIIHRKVYAEVPPRVEYSLTELGKSLNKIINELNDWGLKNRHELIDQDNIKE